MKTKGKRQQSDDSTERRKGGWKQGKQPATKRGRTMDEREGKGVQVSRRRSRKRSKESAEKQGRPNVGGQRQKRRTISRRSKHWKGDKHKIRTEKTKQHQSYTRRGNNEVDGGRVLRPGVNICLCTRNRYLPRLFP